MKNHKGLNPLLKWAGGKRQLWPEIEKHVPTSIHTYYEPFMGGGAVFFKLQPQRAVINDANVELINLYQVIQSSPELLIEDLRQHKNQSDYFYQVRSLDRTPEEYQHLTAVQRASRLIFLNRTCYNGLFRVNRAGQFNVPFGRYKNPNIVNEDSIRAIHAYFISNDIQILNQDFAQALNSIADDAFVYFDPPYDPVSMSSNFTSYTQTGFEQAEQIRLKAVCDELTQWGIKFLLSNSATAFILDLYKDYQVIEIMAKRAINSNAQQRGAVKEVLVKNYA